MLRCFRGLSVDTKLTVIFMGVTLAALLVAGFGFRGHQTRVHKGHLVDDLRTEAEILGSQSAAALRFDVPADTVALLQSLSGLPRIQGACVFDAKDNLFASYPDDPDTRDTFLFSESDGVVFQENRARLTHPIMHDGERIGTITLVSSLSGMYGEIRQSFLVVSGLFSISLFIALVLARSSIKIISKPITSLVETASTVSQTGDYSMRAEKYHPDDLGHLTDRFNEMLEQIESRDIRLRYERQALRESEEREVQLREQIARSERMESLGILAGGIAHDLNNILGPLVAYPDLILDQLDDDSPVRHDLQEMQRAANRAALVIKDLLTLGRRGTYERDPVQLNDVIGDYLQSAGFKALMDEHPAVKVVVDLSPDLKMLTGSTHHLMQVVMNLSLNAVEAMPDGGTLEIRTHMRHLEEQKSALEVIPAGSFVALQMKDSGVGISDEHLAHIFEPFYTRKVMGRSGSGLGLAVVYGILKDLGGFVDLESRPDEGAEFTFFFPATEAPAAPAPSPERLLAGNERILIIDDVQEQRNLATRILTSLGYQTHTAVSGQAGIECVRENDYDMVVLDMIMDDALDGLDTYREIRKLRPAQKCIIASGYSESDRVHAAQAEGAGAFVRKPYTRESLVGAIRATLLST